MEVPTLGAISPVQSGIRGVFVVLYLSLALNVALAGIVISFELGWCK
jgi:hypothetical protein